MDFDNSYSIKYAYLSGAASYGYTPTYSYVNPYSFNFGRVSTFGYGFSGGFNYGSFSPKSYFGADTGSYKNFGPDTRITSYSPKFTYAPTTFKAASYTPKTLSFSAALGSVTAHRPAVSTNRFSDTGEIEGDALFDKALDFVLEQEGGYANVPGDSGGETNKGITKATYNAWLKKNGLPAKSVKNITDAEVRRIYYEEFWKLLGCDKLPSKVALFIFDTGVNMGPSKAKEYLRRYNNGESLDSIVSAREQRYEQIAVNNPKNQKFIKGWRNRMTDLKSTLAVA